MSNSCDACGYRDSEVKPGGGFSKTGRSITLQVAKSTERQSHLTAWCLNRYPGALVDDRLRSGMCGQVPNLEIAEFKQCSPM